MMALISCSNSAVVGIGGSFSRGFLADDFFDELDFDAS
jgi:hypothetical protein